MKQRRHIASRLCKVIDALCSMVGCTTEMNPKIELANTIYRISHLASKCGKNNHSDWEKDFLKLEKELIKEKII